MRKDDIKDDLKSMFRFVSTYFSITLIFMCLVNLEYWNNGVSYTILIKLFVFYIICWILNFKVWDIKLLDKLSYVGKLIFFYPITMAIFYLMFELHECDIRAIIFSLVSYTGSYFMISHYYYKKQMEYVKSCQKIVNKIKENNEDEE